MKQRYVSINAALVFAALVACPAIAPADQPSVCPEVLVAFAAPAVPVVTVIPVVPVVPVVPVAPLVPDVPVVPVVPEALKPPAGQRLSLETVGIGVQIYECKPAKDDPKRFEWVFKAPEAELFDSAGKRIGRHYAGPTWEANDGSKVVGEIKGRDNGPDPGSIPWLLLSAKSTAGNGVFSRIQSIQRLRTEGGKAPAAGCDRAQAGNETRVAYKAGYYFYLNP
jgi:hypothetical protein